MSTSSIIYHRRLFRPYLSPDGERLVWRDANELCIGDASADDELCIDTRKFN